MTRVVLITGSTDGIGRAAARQLAAAGAHVIVHGRSKPKVALNRPPSVMVTPSFEGRTPKGSHNGANFISTE